jgi:hypothetical protein
LSINPQVGQDTPEFFGIFLLSGPRGLAFMLLIFYSRFILAVSVLWLLCAILEFADALKTSRFFNMWILLSVVVVVVLSVVLLVVFSRADG